MNRRKFFSQSLALSTVACIPSYFHSSKKLKILILGGTKFVGPAVVEALLKQRHHLTLFNRGITNPHLFPQIPKIIGDREKGISVYRELTKTTWDAVIDVWPSKPRMVEEATEALKPYTKHYIYISSIAAYKNYRKENMDENSPILEGDTYEEGNYSLNKAICERWVNKRFPANSTILRPGAIVGWRDDGTSFPRLVQRVAQREEMVAPDAMDPTQIIDVKDVGEFVCKCVENVYTKTFNLVGNPIAYKSLLLQVKKVLNSKVKIHWVEPSILVNIYKLQPWSDISFWIPLKGDPEPGFYQISNDLAKEYGLSLRPTSQTIKDAYKSMTKWPFNFNHEAGMSEEKENAVIQRLVK